MGREAVLANRCGLLHRQAAGQGQYREDVAEATQQHRQAQHQVVERGVGTEAAERRTVVGTGRGVGVQQLAETVGARVTDGTGRARQTGGDGTQHQGADRHHQQGHDQQLHFLGLEFLAEVFRCTANHQAGEEYRDQHVKQHAVHAGTDAAEDHLADHHVDQRDHPAQGIEAVLHAVDRTVGRGGGGHRPQHGTGGAEARFFTFLRRGLFNRRVVQRRVGLVLGPHRSRTTDDEQGQHATEDRPALTQVFHVMTKGEHQRDRDQDDCAQLKQVGPGGRVFKWMRRVDTEETTAVGAQLLDRNLAGGRAQWDHLVNALQGHSVHVMSEGLRHTLPHQEQREHQAQRQQAVEGGAGHVDPEVAQGLGGFATDPTAQRDQDGETGGRTDEVLYGEASHLAEVAQGRFTTVVLPVGVGHETDGGVERQGPFLTRQFLRVQRQIVLEQQDREQQHETGQVERQQRQRIFLPALFLICIDTREAITNALDRTEHRREPGSLPFHYLVVEPPQGRCRNQHQGKEGDDQPIVITVHSLLLVPIRA